MTDAAESVTAQELRFRTATYSGAGGRSENQDALGARRGSLGQSCWVMADGLGGQAGGGTASKLAVDAVLEAFTVDPTVSPERVRDLIQAAHEAVLAAQADDPDLAGMASTAVVLLADDRGAIWGHVGDSRLYRFRAGRLAVQTEDHSVPQALVQAGEISPSDIRHHADRARLLQALGSGESLRPAVPDRPTVLEPGDAFLMCTDGFWELITEDEMAADLSKSIDPEAWVRTMAVRVTGRMEEDHDNLSAIAVFVLSSGAEDGER